MTPDEIAAGLAGAWNDGDSVAWAALFAEDSVLVDVLGRVQRGRDSIATEHGKILDTIYRGSRLDVVVESARELGGGLLLVHMTSALTVPAGPRAGVTDAVQTVLVRDGLIEAFQNTIKAAMAGFAGNDPGLAATAPRDWDR